MEQTQIKCHFFLKILIRFIGHYMTNRIIARHIFGSLDIAEIQPRLYRHLAQYYIRFAAITFLPVK